MAQKKQNRSGNGRDRKSRNPLVRVARGVRRVIARIAHRGGAEEPAPAELPAKTARAARRQADIPLDEIANAYTPMQTSLKASFRSDGRDQQSDQEYATGASDTRWNDEDRITNKSGDPRIGTHGRTYEAGERRP